MGPKQLMDPCGPAFADLAEGQVATATVHQSPFPVAQYPQLSPLGANRLFYRGQRVPIQKFIDLQSYLDFTSPNDYPATTRIDMVKDFLSSGDDGLKALVYHQLGQGPNGSKPRLTIAGTNHLSFSYIHPLQTVGTEDLYVLALVRLAPKRDPIISMAPLMKDPWWGELGLLLPPSKENTSWYIGIGNRDARAYYRIVDASSLKTELTHLAGIPKEKQELAVAFHRFEEAGIVRREPAMDVTANINRLQNHFIDIIEGSEERWSQRLEDFHSRMDQLSRDLKPHLDDERVVHALEKLIQGTEREWHYRKKTYISS